LAEANDPLRGVTTRVAVLMGSGSSSFPWVPIGEDKEWEREEQGFGRKVAVVCASGKWLLSMQTQGLVTKHGEL
jgi:hypothetical protein